MSQANLPTLMGTRLSVAPSADQAPLAAFSETVALIYEAGIDRARTGDVLRALERLLDADEIALGPASSKTHAEFHRGSHRRVLCLDIPGLGTDGARLLVRRHAGRPPFEESQVILLDLLRPHLQKANWLASLVPHGPLGRLACDTFVR